MQYTVSKNAILDQYLASARVVNGRPPSIMHIAAPDRAKSMTLDAGKRRRLLFAADGRRSVYDKKAQRYAENRSTFFFKTARSGNLMLTRNNR